MTGVGKFSSLESSQPTKRKKRCIISNNIFFISSIYPIPTFLQRCGIHPNGKQMSYCLPDVDQPISL
jgi:hypothetical protein